jgi:hypothetical protein
MATAAQLVEQLLKLKQEAEIYGQDSDELVLCYNVEELADDGTPLYYSLQTIDQLVEDDYSAALGYFGDE